MTRWRSRREHLFRRCTWCAADQPPCISFSLAFSCGVMLRNSLRTCSRVFARDNDFLMGRGHKAPGHESWACDLDFLLTDKGKRHVIEKTKELA